MDFPDLGKCAYHPPSRRCTPEALAEAAHPLLLSEAMRLAVVTSHPIQYNAPLFRALAQELDVHVFFAHRATARDQAKAGFDTPFTWDVDLLSGYQSSFLTNISRTPSADFFSGCD